MNHWYDKEGQPRYEIKAASGKLRNTTLRDARKHKWVPSVTTVLSVMAKPGLTRWLKQQAALAALRVPREGVSEEVWLAKVLEESEVKTTEAADAGTEIHDAIEKVFLGQDPGEWYGEIARNVKVKLEEYFNGELEGCKIEIEKAFASPLGYGGKCDLHSKSHDGIIVDWKTKPTCYDDKGKPKKLAYPEHAMQLAAYAKGLGLGGDYRALNVFVGYDGSILIHEWDEPDLAKGWRMFELCLGLWKLANNYDPSWSE